MKKTQSIKWQSPGSDVIHEIPEHAKVFFENMDGAVLVVQIVEGRIQISDEQGDTKFIEQINYE